MTKTYDFKTQIELNRKLIENLLFSANSHKRLNNLNFLRHEIAFVEPKVLFRVSPQMKNKLLDFNNMTNIAMAYDYIVANPDTKIDAEQICKLHSQLCMNTNIMGGFFRTTNKVLEIYVNDMRIHAPDYRDIESRLNNLTYRLYNSKKAPINRAYNLHYELIMLQPFDDFNKRLARMVMNWVLIQNGYRPICFNNRTDRDNYISAISARAKGSMRQYSAYMMHTGCDYQAIKAINNLLIILH